MPMICAGRAAALGWASRVKSICVAEIQPWSASSCSQYVRARKPRLSPRGSTSVTTTSEISVGRKTVSRVRCARRAPSGRRHGLAPAEVVAEPAAVLALLHPLHLQVARTCELLVGSAVPPVGSVQLRDAAAHIPYRSAAGNMRVSFEQSTRYDRVSQLAPFANTTCVPATSCSTSSAMSRIR
jgi:hypothetical protein